MTKYFVILIKKENCEGYFSGYPNHCIRDYFTFVNEIQKAKIFTDGDILSENGETEVDIVLKQVKTYKSVVAAYKIEVTAPVAPVINNKMYETFSGDKYLSLLHDAIESCKGCDKKVVVWDSCTSCHTDWDVCTIDNQRVTDIRLLIDKLNEPLFTPINKKPGRLEHLIQKIRDILET